MLKYIINLDRRWIFLAIFLAVGIPILLQLVLPEKTSAMVNDVYRAVEDLPEGSSILLTYDYDPASEGELQPMAAAFIRHCAEKNHKMYFLTLWPTGVPLIQDNLKMLEKEYPHYEYGTDYVNLGYRPGGEGVIKLLVSNIKLIYPSDANGKSLAQIPMTANLKNIQTMDLLINVSAGTPGAKEWIQYASTPYEIPTVVGCTGVAVTGLYPYIPNQLIGMLGAIKGAAEYEKAIIGGYPQLKNHPPASEGLRRMGPQLVAHVLMILLIVLGNIIFFVEKYRGATS